MFKKVIVGHVAVAPRGFSAATPATIGVACNNEPEATVVKLNAPAKEVLVVPRTATVAEPAIPVEAAAGAVDQPH